MLAYKINDECYLETLLPKNVDTWSHKNCIIKTLNTYTFINTLLSCSDFTDDNVIIHIDFPSIPTAGDEFNFTCRATLPERLVHIPNGFTISYDFSGNIIVADKNTDATQSSIMRNGNVFSRDITLNPVKTSDATEYFCEVVFGDLGANNDNRGILSVTSKSFVYIQILYLIFLYLFSSIQYLLLTCH